ncbi:MAG TPA: winged helix-turn-helix domain-containing protein, partial [Methylibium sp.]
RLQSLLRRSGMAARAAAAPAGGTGRVLHFEGLSLDTSRRVALDAGGQELELTSTEYELLLMLAAEPGRVFSRDEILNQLRGHEADLYTRAVDILVSRLRKKLSPLEAIKTLRNAGYCLALAPGVS